MLRAINSEEKKAAAYQRARVNCYTGKVYLHTRKTLYSVRLDLFIANVHAKWSSFGHV